ncbi:MAG: alpha/beta fold hydrolase [Comamonas sp.]
MINFRAAAPVDIDAVRQQLPASWQALQASVRRMATPCGDGELVWHAWGEPGQKPLVLLHGGSGSWSHWVANIPALLGQGYQVWAADLPGFGDSALSPNGCDAQAMVEPLYAGLRELGLLSCQLVGFSFGGLSAALLAAAHPDVARQLVLVGAPSMGVVAQRQYTLKGWRHLPQALQHEAHRHNLAALMLHDPARIDAATLALHEYNVLRDRMPRRRVGPSDTLAQTLPRLHGPVAVVYGEHDALYRGHLAQLRAAYEAGLPRLQEFVLVPAAGHWVQYEQPGAFDRELLRLLEA